MTGVGEPESPLPIQLSDLEKEVAQRRRAEAELRESRERLVGIIDSAMDAIITIDSAQRITLFNNAAERMFHYPAAEAIGQPLDRFIPMRFSDDHRQHIEHFGGSEVMGDSHVSSIICSWAGMTDCHFNVSTIRSRKAAEASGSP